MLETPAHGGKAAIKAAGRQEVERGLNRIEGKPTDISAAGHAPLGGTGSGVVTVTALVQR